jgi:hypothetical protein
VVRGQESTEPSSPFLRPPRRAEERVSSRAQLQGDQKSYLSCHSEEEYIVVKPP